MTSDPEVRRPHAPELDAVLGQRFPVLDDGYVRVVDYMGSDAAIVQAARVSYGAGTKQVSEDRTLIRYLMRHRAYHAVRDVRDQAPRAGADGLLAAVDPPPHGQR